jgi:hypothetical protein
VAQALVAGLSPRRPGFDPGLVHVGFLVDRLALGQVFPCQFDSTGAPLLGKIKKKTDNFSLRLHHKGCTISLKSAAFQ